VRRDILPFSLAHSLSLATTADCQFHGVHLLARITPTIRFGALQIICRSYRPSRVPLEFVRTELGLDTVEECAEFVESCGAVVAPSGNELSTKESTSLRMPDADDDDSAARGVTHSIV
jgi:hypothetical protein